MCRAPMFRCSYAWGPVRVPRALLAGRSPSESYAVVVRLRSDLLLTRPLHLASLHDDLAATPFARKRHGHYLALPCRDKVCCGARKKKNLLQGVELEDSHIFRKFTTSTFAL